MQHTKECLSKIGVMAEGRDGKHGQDGIFRLIAAIMHLLNVGFTSGEGLFDGRCCDVIVWWGGESIFQRRIYISLDDVDDDIAA